MCSSHTTVENMVLLSSTKPQGYGGPMTDTNLDKSKDPVARIATIQDLDKLLYLENISGSEDIWNRSDFQTIFTNGKIKIVLLEEKQNPTSYIAMEVKKKDIIIWSICVHPDKRRRRHGSAILSWLKKTNKESFGALKMTTVVRESDLQTQLFFKANLFRCVEVIDDAWECPPEPGFLFQYKP